ncbi:hypothetical protein [Fodinibius sp. SL11]|uniref:hypothetical protein n=1 Tax=Fodinibius sp. SL11 TaxID=3425690 RepID=UPI003F88180F
MRYTLLRWLLLIPFAALVLISGCNSTGTNGNLSTLSLSFAAQNSIQSTQKERAEMQSSHVEITEAKMLIRRVEFKSDLEDDGVADDSLDFQTGSFVVTLNLDGSLNEVAVSEVPTGQYDEIEFDVHKPEDNETPPDPDFKTGDSGDQRFSVIITGTYDGQDFRYRSNENMDQEIELASPLIIDEDQGSINVTMTVDISKWFVDETGNALNPTNPDNRNAIDESIERSFEDAFEDNDGDGEED